MEDFNNCFHDLAAFGKLIREKHSGAGLFLFGHSMGGAIATTYAFDHQSGLCGLILTGAALKPGDSVSPFHMAVAPVLSLLVPKTGITPLDTDGLSRDESVVSAYKSDPLVCHGKILARTGAGLLRTMQNTERRMPEIVLPLLIMHGTADRLCNPDGSKLFYERASSKDKTLKLYDGWYHELLNEPGKAEVWKFILEWIKKHTGENSKH